MRSRSVSRSKAHLLPELIVVFRIWLRHERGERRAELRRRLKGRETESVRQDQAAQPVAMGSSEAGGDRAADDLSYENGAAFCMSSWRVPIRASALASSTNFVDRLRTGCRLPLSQQIWAADG